MTSMWLKLNVLVPEPKCRTQSGRIVEWFDTRPQPTEAEINAVTDQQVLDNEKDGEAEINITGSKFNRFLFEIFYLMDERIRITEGQGAITRQQFKNGLKTIYKNL